MQRKKKLCVITPVHWSYAVGGIEYQVKLLIENILKNNNVQVTYLSRSIMDGFLPQQYNLIKIANENILNKYGFFFDTWNLLRILKRVNPDVLYQNGGCAYTGISAFYSKRANCKMIWHVASDNDLSFEYKKWLDIKPHAFIDKRILYWGIKNADEVIVQSEYQKKIVKKINHNAPVHLVRNFHPLPERNAVYNKSEKIIWVANIKELKQPEVYLELSKALFERKINVECLMVGAPATHPTGYQELIESHISKIPNIKYLGKLSVRSVNEMIMKSKLLINTSKWEGFPNTFIQAWMRKTPVVSLHCDPDNILKNYKCGLVSGSLEKMIEDVIFLLNNEDQRAIMGENAQKFAFEKHSLDNLTELENILL